MADEPAAPASGIAAPAPGGVQDAGGGTLRVTPATNKEEEGPTLEEQSAAQDEAAGIKAGEAAPEKPAGEEAPAKPAEGEAKAPEVPADFSLEGTVFDGLSEEMQGKVKPFAYAYSQNGTLTDAEVTEAARSTGFSEAAVRQFMAGAEPAVSVLAKPVFEVAGGEANYREFQQWSKADGNLTAAEERTINKALENGDFETVAQLVGPAIERWKADGGGAAPRDVTQGNAGGKGGGGGAEATDVYETWAQVTKDQGNPLYRSDAAFRTKVEQKIARSPLG